MRLLLIIMLGGALGTAARYGVSVWMAERVGEAFPWGTLLVNVLGSFIIGLFGGLTSSDGIWIVPTWARAFVMIGMLGGFTTFSSFSLQTIQLIQDGQYLPAGAYVLSSLLLCLMGTAAGVGLAFVPWIRSS